MDESLLTTAVRYSWLSALGFSEEQVRNHISESISQPGVQEFASPDGNSAALYRPLPWDSSLFGFPVGSVGLVSARTSSEDPAPAVRALKENAESSGVRLMYAKIPAEDGQSAKALLSSGFSRVDEVIMLAKKAGAAPAAARHEAGEAQLEQCVSIARSAFTESRFYKDQKIGAERAASVYEKWVSDAAKDPAKGFLICEEKGQVAGFLVYARKHMPPLGISTLSVDLIAVSEEHRGKGFGKRLMERFLNLGGADYFLVGTQQGNSKAVSLYEKMGFRKLYSESVFHWWA